jgi:hypothetical protein
MGVVSSLTPPTYLFCRRKRSTMSHRSDKQLQLQEMERERLKISLKLHTL